MKYSTMGMFLGLIPPQWYCLGFRQARVSVALYVLNKFYASASYSKTNS